MSLAAVIAYIFALFIAAAIPGPGMTAVVGRALSLGAADSLATGIGLIVGDVIYLTAVILGLSVLAQSFEWVFIALKYLGALYLGYVAYKIWTAGLMTTDGSAPSRAGLGKSFVNGVLLCLGNPKPMLFYVALMPSIIPLAQILILDYLQLVAITVLILLIVIAAYVALAVRAKSFMQNSGSQAFVNRGAAAILAFTAGFIALNA